MLSQKQHELLAAKREALLNQLSILDEHVQAGRIDKATAHQQMCERFSPDYFQQLESIQAALTKDDRNHQLRGLLAGLAIMIVPLLLLAHFGGITGLATLIVDRPVTLDVNQTFTQSTTYIPDIARNITSLRATGTYVGNGALRIIHIGENGTQQTIHSIQAINGTLLGNQTRNATFDNRCEQTCDINTTAGAIRIELTNGTLTLNTLTYTVSETRNETTPAERETEEEAPVPQPTPPPTVSLENQTNTTTGENTTTPTSATGNITINTTRPSYILGKNGTLVQIPENGSINISIGEENTNITLPENETQTPVPDTPNTTPDNHTAPPGGIAPSKVWKETNWIPPARRINFTPPGIQKLPELRPEIIEKARGIPMSRGTEFQAAGKVGGHAAADARNYSMDNLYRYNTKAAQMVGSGEARAIILLKSSDPSPIPGNQYGKLLFTTYSNRSLPTIKNNLEHVDLITIDEPMKVSAVAADATIQGPQTRSLSGAGGARSICLIDSGVDRNVVGPNLRAGIDFIDGDNDPNDEHGHGTLMASTILTVAPEAQIYAAKILNASGDGWSSDVIQSIDWCMQQDVDIISMSVVGYRYDSWCDNASIMAQKANEAAARGILVVAAAGNDGIGSMASPACASLATSVAATDATTSTEGLWSQSSFSPVTDILAPGVNITATGLGGAAQQGSGTSFSAALTAGAGAVIMEATGLNGTALQDRLRSTGIIINTPYGAWTRVDTLRAYQNNQTTGASLVQDGNQSEGPQDGQVSPAACSYGRYCANDLDCGAAYVCDGETICQERLTCNTLINSCDMLVRNTCSGNCDSTCRDGSSLCYNTAAGTDPYNVCPGGYACSGDSITNEGLCSAGTACGYTTGTTCSSCTQCTPGSSTCTNVAKYSDDTTGVNTCSGSTYTCDGSGNCEYDNGVTCGANSQCVSEVCKTNYYQGVDQTNRCVPNQAYCVQGTSYYGPGTTVGDSQCSGATGYTDTWGDSIWLSTSGRFEIRRGSDNALALVIDKYGALWFYQTASSASSSGWLVKNSVGSTVASVDTSTRGFYRSSISQGTTPSTTGYLIKNAAGTTVASISTSGAVRLAADYMDYGWAYEI